MDNLNENVETVVTTEPEVPAAPVEEPVFEEPAVGAPPAEPAPKARKFPQINITRKGLIIGGIAAAVVIIAVVLIVLLTGGNGKVYEYTKDGSTVTVTVLEDGFKMESLSEQSFISTWRTSDEGTYQKNSDGTYTLSGYWTSEGVRLVHFTGNYYLIKRDDGKAATDVVYELGKDNTFRMYAFYDDISYSKNDDGTYRLGDVENVKLKDAGDGLYSVVSVNGEKSDNDATLIKLDPKLGVYRVFYRSSTTYKVIEGEEKTIICETTEGTEYSAEYWIEGNFLTAFRVTKACDYLQKQRGDDRIVYLLDEDGDVEDIITITDGRTYLDGVTYKELSDGKYYGIEKGQEYRLHLNSNGTYKRYEDVSDGEIRGRLELVWASGEELLLKANDVKLISIVVDGKTMTVATYGGDPIELTKVK